MLQWGLIGWIAGGIALLGSYFAGSPTRKKALWGWLLWFVGNACWIAYGVTIAAMPLIFYNTVRAFLSLRGAHNNTWKRKQQIRELQKGKENVGSKN